MKTGLKGRPEAVRERKESHWAASPQSRDGTGSYARPTICLSFVYAHPLVLHSWRQLKVVYAKDIVSFHTLSTTCMPTMLIRSILCLSIKTQEPEGLASNHSLTMN